MPGASGFPSNLLSSQCPPPWIRTGRQRTQTNFSFPSCRQCRSTLSLSEILQTKHCAMSYLQLIQFFYDLIRVKVMHHCTEGERFNIYTRTCETSTAEIFLDNILCPGDIPDHIPDERILCDNLLFCHCHIFILLTCDCCVIDAFYRRRAGNDMTFVIRAECAADSTYKLFSSTAPTSNRHIRRSRINLLLVRLRVPLSFSCCSHTEAVIFRPRGQIPSADRYTPLGHAYACPP